MPVHDLGYRSWQGDRSSHFLRPLVIAKAGVSLILKRRWLRIVIILAWLPVILPAFGIFAFEYSTTDPWYQRAIHDMVRNLLRRPDLAQLVLDDPEQARHQVWSTLILMFFRYPQAFSMVGLVGLITPLLISYDLRTKAYLLYFSRPLTPTEYILGKSAVLWFFLGAATTFPAMILYLMGVLLSPDLTVVYQTWDIPLRIIAATIVLIVPTTMLAVFYSSLTAESRYATFAWFATWIMGAVAYQMFRNTERAVKLGGRRRMRRFEPDEIMEIGERWHWLSPYHTLGKVEAWVFNLDQTSSSVIPAVAILVGITIIGFWIVRNRIIARLSV